MFDNHARSAGVQDSEFEITDDFSLGFSRNDANVGLDIGDDTGANVGDSSASVSDIGAQVADVGAEAAVASAVNVDMPLGWLMWPSRLSFTLDASRSPILNQGFFGGVRRVHPRTNLDEDLAIQRSLVESYPPEALVVVPVTQNETLLDAYAAGDRVPEHLLCGISFQLMDYPVWVPNDTPGVVWDRAHILAWLSRHSTNPNSRRPLVASQLESRDDLRGEIEAFVRGLSLQLQLLPEVGDHLSVLASAWLCLNLDPGSTTSEALERAYHQLAMIYHPDRPDGDAVKFAEISAAHDVLVRHLDEQAHGAGDCSSSRPGI